MLAKFEEITKKRIPEGVHNNKEVWRKLTSFGFYGWNFWMKSPGRRIENLGTLDLCPLPATEIEKIKKLLPNCQIEY